MHNLDRAKKLEDHKSDLAKQNQKLSERTEIFNQGVKAIFILNGGAAVAVLAFLQAIMDENPIVSKFAVASLVIFSIGIMCAAQVNFCRYHVSDCIENDKDEKSRKYHWNKSLQMHLPCCSIAAFFIAVVCLSIGIVFFK